MKPGKLLPLSPRAPLLDPTRYWECPSCFEQHISKQAGVITPMHNCKQHKGMAVPYVQVFPGRLNPTPHHHRVIERGDFVGGERGLRRDIEGRVAMAVHTERKDGSHDTAVFPGRARADQVKD